MAVECGFKGGPSNGKTIVLQNPGPQVDLEYFGPTKYWELDPQAEVPRLKALYDRIWESDDHTKAMYQFRRVE